MLLKNISALNFRNYQELNLELDLSKPLNFIISPNGMGKSNLLELIYYLSYLRSFRNASDKEITKKNETFFFIEGKFENKFLKNKIKIKYSKNKELIYNDKKVKKFSDLFGRLLTVLFSNEDIFIINGSPAIRRKFFDIFISVLDSKYLFFLKKYYEIIKQKNFILKDKKQKNLIAVYNFQLAEIIYYIQTKRVEIVNKINNLFQSNFNSLGLFKDKVKIIYSPSIKNSLFDIEIIKKELEKNIDKELDYGFSLLGSHRDNYIFLMNGIVFSKYASLGQTRLASLVLKFVQSEYYKEFFGIYPIILLDDVILELDKERQKRFIQKISEYKQIFLTVTNDEYLNLFKNKELINVIRIENGRIK